MPALASFVSPVPKYEFRVEGEIFKMKGGNEDGIMTNRLIRH